MRTMLIHIPKNAGNAIYQTYSGQGMRIWDHNIRVESYQKYADYAIGKIARKFPHLFKKMYASLAVIRNPWDRVYSAYNYLSISTDWEGDPSTVDALDYEKYIKPYGNFETFVKEGLTIASQQQLHFLPQLFWITDEEGRIVVDYVIRYESIDEELKRVVVKLGLSPRELKVVNKKNFADYRQMYTEETKEIVRNIYSDIIEKFDYTF